MTWILPDVGRSSPAIRLSSVDLPGAGRPHEGHEILRVQIEIDSHQHRNLDLIAMKLFVQIANDDDRFVTT